MSCRSGDSERTIYQYAVSQTQAIAQSTAVQLGALHSAAILLRNDDKFSDADGKPRYRLYTWGRDFYGQLGTHREECSSVWRPRSVCLGYTQYDVRTRRLSCRSCHVLQGHRPVTVHKGIVVRCNTAIHGSQAVQETSEEEVMPVSVTCGSHHTAVITRRGDLISWGMGTSGQTGHGLAGDVRLHACVRMLFAAGGYLHASAPAHACWAIIVRFNHQHKVCRLRRRGRWTCMRGAS